MNIIYIITKEINHYDFVKQKLKEKFNIDCSEILKTEKGKPYIENSDIHFNITHSKDFRAVAIGQAQVGIDAEFLRKADLRVAKRFTKPEQEYISETDSDNRFFEIWTKKEAYLKYLGVGLSGGLDSFNVLEKNDMFKTFIINGFIITVCSEEEYRIEDIYEI